MLRRVDIYLVFSQCLLQVVHSLRLGELAIHSLGQLHESTFYLTQQNVHTGALLHRNHYVWTLLGVQKILALIPNKCREAYERN